MNEVQAIQTIADALRRLGLDCPVDDDAFFDPASRLILTTDLLVEDTHFAAAYFSPVDVGWKAAAVNISDIAAMGGQPDFLLVSLGLPDHVDAAWLEGLYEGLGRCARQYGCQIAGGDTVFAERVTINVAAVGHLPQGATLGKRSGARPGDQIIATGLHGQSAAGLDWLRQPAPVPGMRDDDLFPLIHDHLHPMPRLSAAKSLAVQFSRYALMDTSDGLADGLMKIAAASGVDLVADAALIPQSKPLWRYASHRATDPWSWVLYGGEDFQLLACIPGDAPLPEGWLRIGAVEAPSDPQAGGRAWVIDTGGERRALSFARTFQHFSEATFHD